MGTVFGGGSESKSFAETFQESYKEALTMFISTTTIEHGSIFDMAKTKAPLGFECRRSIGSNKFESSVLAFVICQQKHLFRMIPYAW